MTDSKQLLNLYHAGMAFAAQLRLHGEHEAAHDIEVYVIQQRGNTKNDDDETEAQG